MRSEWRPGRKGEDPAGLSETPDPTRPEFERTALG